MKLELKRIARRDTYTIGRLYIDGVYFCDTCEDKDRGLKADMPLDQIKSIKVAGETAIPEGEYGITLNVKSPRFSRLKAYASILGFLPRLIDVPGYEGVLIHIGNSAKDSAGCILVGKNKEVGKVMDSTATFWTLYKILDSATNRREKITLHVH